MTAIEIVLLALGFFALGFVGGVVATAASASGTKNF